MNYKKEIVTFAKLLEEKGFLDTFGGNISIVDRDSNKLYITPSKKRKLWLTEDMIAVLDFETGEQIEGSCKASSEYRLHKCALHARPDCTAAVHSHATYCSAYAYCCKPVKIDCCNSFAVVKGELPCIPWGKAGTDNITDGLPEALANKDACLLGNHGIITVQKDLYYAAALLETVEECLRNYTVALQVGTPCAIPR